MSWHTPPPLSPRKPKIQQQSWDEVPKINLYDPTRDDDFSNSRYPGTPSSSSMKTSKRSGYQKYCLPNPQHQMSDPGSYNTSIKSPKSPRGAQTFEFELTSTSECSSKSPMRSTCRYYEDSSTSESAPAILSYGFDAISPKMDQHGKSLSFFQHVIVFSGN